MPAAAPVHTNGLHSVPFLLHCGTKQPPPPFATEPLAIRLHPEGGIEGIARAGKDSTLSLYADDLLL